jgi:DNA-binding Lrp family transcriptional regulator
MGRRVPKTPPNDGRVFGQFKKHGLSIEGMFKGIDLTVSIMREMATSPSHWNANRSYVDVARKLGVDEDTVRNRLKMMREMGLLRGWRLVPNARLLGMSSSNVVLDFKDQESKDAAVPRIRNAQGIVLIQHFYGKALQVTVFHREADDPERNLMSQGIAADVVTLWRVNLPRCEHKPKQVDWRIIAMMLRDAETKLPEVALKVRSSSRTVKRRVNLMMASSAFFMQPLLNLRKAVGVTPCQLLVKCAPAKKRAIDEAIASKFERTVFKLTNSDTHSTFTILCANVGEMKDILGWARSQPGVELAKTDILEQQDYVYDWLEQEVKSRIEKGDGEASARSPPSRIETRVPKAPL